MMLFPYRMNQSSGALNGLKLVVIFFVLQLPNASAAVHSNSFILQMINDSQMDLLIPARAAPKSHPVWLNSERFGNIEDAIVSVSSRFNPQSIKEDREYLGVVLENNQGKKPYYVYTVSHGDVGQDTVAFRTKRPKNFSLVAVWHTHGGEHWSRQYFSAADTQLAKKWDVPVYLADHTGSLKVFRPETKTLSRMRAYSKGLGKVTGISKGQAATNPEGPIRVATRNKVLNNMFK